MKFRRIYTEEDRERIEDKEKGLCWGEIEVIEDKAKVFVRKDLKGLRTRSKALLGKREKELGPIERPN